MSLLSLVCLLLVSSSALANYGNNYRTVQRDPVVTNYGTPLQDKPTGYGAPLQDKPTGYGAPLMDKPIAVGYGQQLPQLDKPIAVGYGQQPLLDKPTGYGQQQPLLDKPTGYGASPVFFDKPASGYGYGKKLRFRDMNTNYGYGKKPQFDAPVASYGYGKQVQFDAPVASYGNGYSAGYGNKGEQQFDTPTAPQNPLSQWDILCLNQAPNTIIVLSDQASWVVCIDTGKGQIQSCQPGLIYIKETNKCERRSKGDHPCNQGVCKNGAQCVPTSQSEYECRCAPGYDGPTCELDARVCQTQNPCGAETCQSFEVGAALSYVCLIGGNQAYGPSPSQATPNPCPNSPNGPQSLSYTTHGFLICDGDRMHIRACPGNTIWDGSMQTCTYPQQAPPQRDIVSSYGSSYSSAPQQDMPVVNSYGASIQRDAPVVVNSYGASVQRDMPVVNSYGASIQRDMPVVNSYGASIQRDAPVASSYGNSYGSAPVILRDAPVVSSYGNNVQRDQTGYGAPKFRDVVVKSAY